jgi:probable HAF family extracellular repeat protein
MKMMRGLLTPILLLNGLAPAQVFTVTDLGPGVIPAGVNDREQVAAMRPGAPGGSLWTEGAGFRDLAPLPGFPLSFTRGINNRGDVVGYSEEEETSSFHATLWPRSNGTSIDLGPSVVGNASANAINYARQATGNLGCCRAFLWTRRGGMVDIGPPPDDILFYGASAISADGTVVGSMGNNDIGTSFFWTKATGIREIPIPSSFATGINRGFVIGASSCLKQSLCDTNNLHAYIWNRHLGAFDLGTLPGDNVSLPSGINSRLMVVGGSQNNVTGTSTAFFWSPGLGMIDLNKLINTEGWVLTFATGINDSVQIVGYGTLNGVLHGFLLSVPPQIRPH